MDQDGISLLVFLLLVLWALPWKGFALWRAAKRGEKKWFVAILVINTLALLEILYIFVFSRKKKPLPEKPHLPETNAVSGGDSPPFSKKEQAKIRLLEAVKNRGRITNNEAEILLNVSDARGVGSEHKSS